MTNNVLPSRGDVWRVDLDPVRGHEQAGRRPCVIISVDLFNESPAGLVILLPITTKGKRIPWQVPLDPPDGGLQRLSFIKCDDVRSESTERLVKRLGSLSPKTMAAVEDRLRILMGL
jgi:mRNA interferase MazF